MKKKFGAILMAGIMACTMTAGIAFTTGCGSKVMPDFVMPDGGFNTDKEVEISFYHTMGKNLKGVLDQYITDFNKLYPKIKIKTEAIGKYDDVFNQISTEITVGDQPNIAYCYPDHVAFYNQAKVVETLDAFLPGSEYSDMQVTRADGTKEYLCITEAEKNDFIDIYYNEGKTFGDDKMYVMPFSKSVEVLYYNKKFFEKEKLQVPTTWDEMEAVCAKIKELKPNSIPLGYDSEANWFITMCEQYESSYTSATGEHYLFDNETNRAFVAKFAEWYKKGYVTTQAISGAYTSNLFKEMNSYMSIGSSAGAANQAPAVVDGEAPFEVGIAPIPQINKDKPKVISQGPSVCIFKKQDPQEVLASWLFIKYLITNVGFQAQFSSVSGYVPVLKSVLQNETYAGLLASANGYADGIAYLSAQACMDLANNGSLFVSPAFNGSSKARTQVGALMQSAFIGTKSIDKAFKDAIEECRY